MKIAIFTALFGDYDEWRDPLYVQPNADYFVFTDQDIKSDVYERLDRLLQTWDGPNNIRLAREVKILSGYKVLCSQGYDLIIYHDCNIVQKNNIQHLIDLQKCDLMILKHPTRICIYDEFHACNDGQKDKTKKMFDQVQGYANEGYPAKNGLAATGIIFRRNNKKVLKFCQAWLKEINNGSHRDQLSFNYVAWKLKYKFDFFDWQYIYDYWNYNSNHKR